MNISAEQFLSTNIPIVEIFNSISGEGVSAGRIVTFVRVAGCDLRCVWCDTKYSFQTEGPGIEQLLPEDILSRVNTFETNELICSGGEPLEHGYTKRLLPAYLHSKGLYVRIETSGGSKLYNAEELELFDLNSKTRPVYTMDIKCPGSKMADRNIFENISVLDGRDELKFVVTGEGDFSYAFDVIKDYKNHLSKEHIDLNFSPVFGAITPKELTELLLARREYFTTNDLKARLSLQLHKFIWPPHQRGV